MRCKRLGVLAVSQLVQEHRRPLDVGEEERDCPGRKVLYQGRLVSLNVFRAMDGPENFDDAIDGTLQLLLRALGRKVWGKRQKEHRYDQPTI